MRLPVSERNAMSQNQTTTKVGNLVADPELRVIQPKSGSAPLSVANCRIAVKGADDAATSFYDLIVFGDMVEHVATSLHKGNRVVVYGRPQLRQWKGKDGEDRTSKEIVVEAIGPDLRWATAEVTKTKASPKLRVVPDEVDEENF